MHNSSFNKFQRPKLCTIRRNNVSFKSKTWDFNQSVDTNFHFIWTAETNCSTIGKITESIVNLSVKADQDKETRISWLYFLI